LKKIKICIVGCGAIGTWLGVNLISSPRIELSCLARASSVQEIKTHGLRLDHNQIEPQSTQVAHPSNVSDDASILGHQDWIILAVKATSLLELVPQILPMVGSQTSIWTAMNGIPWWFTQGLEGPLKNNSFESIDPNRVISQSIPLKHWVGGVVHSSCSLLKAGHAKHHFGNRLLIGEPTQISPTRAGASANITPRVQELSELLCSVGFEALATEHIQKDIWYKLWGNMTMNPISALTGATTDKILSDPLVKNFVSGVMLEAQDIGNRIGIPILQTPEDRHNVTAKLGAFKTSMLQDIESKRSVEIDVLLTAVLELATWTQVPSPLTSALLGLTRLKAQTMGLYPIAHKSEPLSRRT